MELPEHAWQVVGHQPLERHLGLVEGGLQDDAELVEDVVHLDADEVGA